MKRFLTVILAITCVFAAAAGTTGCTSADYDPVRYTHPQNDGHLHEYIHKLHPDQYICQLCGKVYEGDPANLREA